MYKYVLAALSILPVIWFHAVPDAEKYCQSSPYVRQTVDGQGNPVSLMMQSEARDALCELITNNPRPIK